MLVRAEEQLRQTQKFEAIGQLSGGIAHDFNNILTVIRGSVDLLRRDNLGEDRRNRYLDAIASTADRAAKLTNQMLAFARRQSLKPEAFDAKAALENIVDMARAVTGARITFDLQLPENPCYVLVDRGQFETALTNIILNGRDAMNGEGRLLLTLTSRPAIAPSSLIEGDTVGVSITDTGIGIAQDRLQRIFEPFFTTKPAGLGTGLGLSQAIGFAKQSGGDIRVSSVEGVGSSFTLYLPQAAAPQSPTVDPVVAHQPIEGAGRSILVVEDNEDVGALAVLALQEFGFETVFAPNAEHALTELATRAGRFDLVFSDVVMPGMSGLELASEVARLYPGLRVVLVSGYSDVIAHEGTHGFRLLRKPYSIDELSMKLARVFASSGPDTISIEIVDT